MRLRPLAHFIVVLALVLGVEVRKGLGVLWVVPYLPEDGRVNVAYKDLTDCVEAMCSKAMQLASEGSFVGIGPAYRRGGERILSSLMKAWVPCPL
jgi:hypothetical protein